MKALILYGTRYGATKSTSEEIAKVLGEENFDVKVLNAQEEKVKDISEYGLVVVGSGTACGRWVSEAEDFLKKFRKEFETKKLALFVSSLGPISEKEGNTAEVAKMHKLDLEDRISKYSLKPISVGFLGGIIDFNKMNFLSRKGMEIAFKEPLKKHAFKETAAGAYDLRDWDKIRNWAKELSQAVL